MAQFDDDYEVPTAEPETRDFDPLPAVEYAAQIIDSDIVDTKSGTGRMLKLTWEVTEGPFERRKFWQQINYRNQSAQVQEIGRKQLDEITYSTGITRLTDTQDLHFKPCHVRLKIKPGDGQYAPKNEVVFVKRLGAVTQQNRSAPAQQSRQSASQSTTRPAQAASGGSGRPWGAR